VQDSRRLGEALALGYRDEVFQLVDLDRTLAFAGAGEAGTPEKL
jgi:hypothetical protein